MVVKLFRVVLIFQASMFISCTGIKKDWATISGAQYECQQYLFNETCIRLSVIKDQCKLERIPAEGLHSESKDRIVLKYKNEVKEIKGPEDLAEVGNECIEIKNKEQALEYIRFFSSTRTYYLFNIKELEIFPKNRYKECYNVCLENKIWKKLKLHDPIIIRKKEGFEIIRFVIKPIPLPYWPTIFKEIVLVTYDGKIIEIDWDIVTSCEKYTEGLGF